jgi:hypothetical protein
VPFTFLVIYGNILSGERVMPNAFEAFRLARIKLVAGTRQIEHLVAGRDKNQLRLIRDCKHERSVGFLISCQDDEISELCQDCGLKVVWGGHQPQMSNTKIVTSGEFRHIERTLDIPVVLFTPIVATALADIYRENNSGPTTGNTTSADGGIFSQ